MKRTRIFKTELSRVKKLFIDLEQAIFVYVIAKLPTSYQKSISVHPAERRNFVFQAYKSAEAELFQVIKKYMTRKGF